MTDFENNCEPVARCAGIQTQLATFSQNRATHGATNSATHSLKALAGAVLERNSQRNQCATTPEKPRNFYPEKQPPKLRGSCAEITAKMVKCYDCKHFKCFNKHGKGAGSCLICAKDYLWSERLHECSSYQLNPEIGMCKLRLDPVR